ncbi:MAG: hypothetical protein ACREIC_32355, partial [Limisphaerales bacterium]
RPRRRSAAGVEGALKSYQERKSGGAPSVALAQDLMPRLHKYVTRFLQHHGNEMEIGGMWTGEFAMEGGWPSFRINGFIEAGPNAEFSSDSILFDGDYQIQMLQAIRQHHPTVGNMGCFHVHPGKMDECSAGDYLADIAAVKESDTRALMFGIITLDNPRRDPRSIYYENLKLDLFVLAEQTRFDYAHVRPRMEKTPVIEPASEAGADVAADPFLRPGPFGVHRSWGSGLLEDKKRLVAEVRAMEERYGDHAILRYQRNQLFWEYTVVESGRRFPIEVRYPRRYPLEPPRIISLLPLPSSPHQLVNNELCWINRAAGDWNPARDTAATCLHAAHRWFACLLVYLTLGKWPEEANDEPLRTI